MHHCLKKKKTEEVGMMIQVEDVEKDEVGTTVPQLHKGAKKVTFKFLEWMTRNNMGAENAIKCYVVQGKGFLIHYEEINPSYIADNWLCPVGIKILLPMPLENHLFPEGTIHPRKNPYSGFQKFIEFQTYRFYTFYLIDPKFSNKEKYLFKQNFDSVHARLNQKRKKLFKESVVLTMKNQSEKMSKKKNLKFNTAIIISIIQKFLSSKTVQRYMKPFKAIDEKTDAKVRKLPALGTLVVRNLTIVLRQIFGEGKRANTFKKMLISKFIEWKEVDDVQFSIFKDKMAQSGSALISYEKDSFIDILMTMYQQPFRICLQPKLASDNARNKFVPLQDDNYFFSSDQACQLRCLSHSLDWMRDVLIKNFPDEFSFKGFTSGAFRKTWANMGGDNLDDSALKEARPK